MITRLATASTCDMCTLPIAAKSQVCFISSNHTNQSQDGQSQDNQSQVTHLGCSREGQEYLAKREREEAKSRAAFTLVDVPAPKNREYRPYQKAGIAYAADPARTRGCILGDEPGLGKTIQAIGFANVRTDLKRVLVVAPKSLVINWCIELQAWSSMERRRDIAVVSVGQLKEVEDEIVDLLVLDEAHFYKNLKAARTQSAVRLARHARFVLVLTGTPVPNRVSELFPILQMVCPNEFDPPGVYKKKRVGAGEGAGFRSFATKYCAAHEVVYWITSEDGKKIKKTRWDTNGASNLDELNERLRVTCMVRRTKQQVLSELPSKERQIIPFEVKGLKERADFLATLNVENYDETLRKLRSEHASFEAFTRMRLETARLKLSHVLEHVEEELENTRKILLFAHHKEILDKLEEKLASYGTVRVDGLISDKEKRQHACEAFQKNDRIRIFIGSVGAAGVGLNLTAASLVGFVELPLTPAELTQCEDRAHRIGQKDSVRCQHYVADGSIDARIARILIRKQAIAEKVLA